ncbi:DUF3150 domain-containing protein [Vibrio cholerae]
MSNSNINVLNDVVAVHLRFSTWTGRKKLAESDLSLRGETPPKEIISLGSKYTTDPKDLKVFNTLKRQAERLCLSVGIRFMGGYAIPSSKADALALGLSKIVHDYEKEADAYCSRHDLIQDEWVKKYPEYEQKLRAALTPAQEVKSKISASYSMFKVQSAQAAVQSVDISMGKEIDGLSNSLDDDILKTANKLLSSLTDAIAPNRTNVNGLVGLREKVEGLAFLNGRFSRLVQEIKKVEEQMPIAGKLSTDETNILSGLLFRMANKEKLLTLMKSLQEASTNQPAMASVQSEPQNAGPLEPMKEPESDFAFNDDDFSFDLGDSTIDDQTTVTSDAVLSAEQTAIETSEEPESDFAFSDDDFSFDLGETEKQAVEEAVYEPVVLEKQPEPVSNNEWFF